MSPIRALLRLSLVAAVGCEPADRALPNAEPPGMSAADRAARASARDVVSLLAAWDTAGLTLDGTSPNREARDSLLCWVPSENCETDEPGWDQSSIVTGYEIVEVTERGDSASAVVRYEVVGELLGWQLKDSAWTQMWRPKLARSEGRWFIVDPESQRPPALSLNTTLRVWAKTGADSAAVRNLGAQRPPA